jgi:hypothetical protein
MQPGGTVTTEEVRERVRGEEEREKNSGGEGGDVKAVRREKGDDGMKSSTWERGPRWRQWKRT